MAFTFREIPKSEAPLYSGRHFLNRKGEIQLRRIIAEDRERRMYLVSTQGGGGPDNLPGTFIFYMCGLYIKFLGGYDYHETSAGRAWLFTIENVMIPMNLEDKTEDIIQLIFEAHSVYSGKKYERDHYEGQIVVEKNIAYSTPTWVVDEGKGIFLTTGGPFIVRHDAAISQKWLEKRQKIMYRFRERRPEDFFEFGRLINEGYIDFAANYQKEIEKQREILSRFSHGERLPEALYEFCLFIGDAHIDFLARYHLEDNDQKLIWQVTKAGIPVDFQAQKEDLISWITKAVMHYTIQDNHIPIQEVDMSGLTVGEAPGEVRQFWGARYYPFFK